jgi:hypothetical protein
LRQNPETQIPNPHTGWTLKYLLKKYFKLYLQIV